MMSLQMIPEQRPGSHLYDYMFYLGGNPLGTIPLHFVATIVLASFRKGRKLLLGYWIAVFMLYPATVYGLLLFN